MSKHLRYLHLLVKVNITEELFCRDVCFKISLTGVITVHLCACAQLFVLLSLRVD